MGIAEDLQEKWEGVLQWSDENNLPLRSISDALEEKGIPALPFFIFLILLIVGGILYFTVFKGAGAGITIFPPKDTTFTLTIYDSVGRPVPGAEVTLASLTAEQPNIEGTTDADGVVTFSKVKVPSSFIVSAVDSEGNTLKLEDDELTVTSSTKSETYRLEAPVITETITLTIEVKGPTNGDEVVTTLYGADSVPVSDNKRGLIVRFPGLSPKTTYTIISRAPGFNDEEKSITLKDTDDVTTITLREKGKIAMGSIRVRVVDSDSQKPLKDAAVEVRDIETDAKVLTPVKTGENGEINPLEHTLGKKIRVTASLKGYVAEYKEASVADTTNVLLELKKIPEAELKAIKITVKDEAGGPIVNPVVKLFDKKNVKVAESNPQDGIALFSDVGSFKYYATIIKPGFLPKTIKDLEKGNSYEVKMVAVSQTNAARLKVQVENLNGDAVPQATVALFYEDGLPLGVVDRITGPDGIASYEELPLVKIYARASFGGRTGSSGIISLIAQGEKEEEAANSLKITLKPAKGRAVVLVKDHYSGRNVENAKVEFSPSVEEFASVGFCQTKAGRCNLLLQEGFYVVMISAPNYDTFTSSEFEIKPNIDNKLQFDVVASAVASQSKIAFSGVFNLKGDAVDSLSPSTTYVAKFSISRPPVKITKGEVQVRIGNAGGMESEVAQIIGWDAPGAFITKGANSERAQAPIIPFEAPSPSPSPTPAPSVNSSLKFVGEKAVPAGSESSEISFAGDAPIIESPKSSNNNFAGDGEKSASQKSSKISFDSQGAQTSKISFADGSSTPSKISFADEEAAGYKYVQFEFPPFEGTKELSVQFRTKSVEKGRVDLQYRSAFFTSTEVLRDPQDAAAERGAFLAAMHSQTYELSYEGKCENGICIETNFEGKAGTAQDNYEAAIGETFKLNFRLVAPKGTTLELSAPLGDETIALTEAESLGAKGVLKTTEDRQILSLTAPEENSEGTFTMQARRLANNIDLRLDVTSGTDSVSKSYAIRIVGEKPDLKVSFNIVADRAGGKSFKALKENRIIFTVTDSLDIPLKNAYVSLGDGVDALGGGIMEAQMQEAKDGSITYVIESVNPAGIGSISYKIVAQGFKQKKGTIPVLATTLFTLETKALSLSVNSKEAQEAQFGVQNLLQNELRFSYLLNYPDTQYTEISLALDSAKVKANSELANTLKAAISESLLTISNKPETLKEKVQGRVRITAKLGSVTQQEEIPFVVSSEFKQEEFSSLWSVSSESFNFRLEPPASNESEQTVGVSNQAPYPILVNHQSTIPGVRVEPLSQNIDPGTTFEFKVKARNTNSDPCRFEEDKKEGKIEFFASTSGLTSKKSAKSSLTISSSENCKPGDGLYVSFPMTITLQLPENSRTKSNSDGSLLVELPSKETFLFESGHQQTNTLSQQTSYNTPAFPAVSKDKGMFVVIPPGVFIKAPSKYVKQSALIQKVSYAGFSGASLPLQLTPLSTSAYQVSFPFTSYVDFDTETEFSRQGEYKVASIEDFDVYFPSNVPLIRGRSVKERRATLPPNSPLIIQLTPFVNSQQSLEVSFPVEATFIITESVRLRKDDYTGSRAIQFQSGTTITLPADAIVSTDPAAQGGGGDLFNELRKITIPMGSIIRIPSPYAKEGIYGEQHIELPFRIQFKVPKSDSISLNLDPGGIQARTISTEIYEMAFTPGTSRAGLQFADGSRIVDVAPLAPITLRPTDFGVIGIKKKLPVAITITVPSAASVKKKGGLTQVEFVDGSRLLLENADMSDLPFETKELRIPAGTPIVFSANNPLAGSRMIRIEKSEFGTERFTVFLPARVVYHFPLSGAILRPPNVVQNELSKYEAVFNSGSITFDVGEDSNDVALSPQESLMGVIFQGVDLTLPGADFEFKFSIPMTVQIPQGAFQAPRMEPYSQKYREVFHSFRFLQASEAKIANDDHKDEFRFLGTRILVPNFDFPSADFQSDPRTFDVPQSTLIIPKIQKDDDGKYWLHGTFGSELQFTLPSGIFVDEKERTIDLRDCLQIEIKLKDRAYSFPAVRTIKFPANARIVPRSDAADSTQLVLSPPGEEISLELCAGKGKKGAYSTVEDSVRALIAFEYSGVPKDRPNYNDKTLDLEFTDDTLAITQHRFVCIQNWGFQALKAEFKLDENPLGKSSKALDYKEAGYLGPSVSTELDGAIKSAAKPSAWEQEPYMLITPKEPAAQSCDKQSIKLEIGVPEQYLDDNGCIAKEFDGEITDPDKTFVTVFGEYNGKAVSERIGMRIKLVKKGTCRGLVTEQFSEMMGSFFVNYADSQNNLRDPAKQQPMKLYFKGPTQEHKRSIAMINNMDEKVTVDVLGSGLALLSFENSVPQTFAVGDSAIITLSARKAGIGTLEIVAKGLKRTVTRYVQLEVFDLDPTLKGIYSSTPMGDLLFQVAANAKANQPAAGTPSGTTGQPASTNSPSGGGSITPAPFKNIVMVSEPRISFADDASKSPGDSDKSTITLTSAPRALPVEVMQCQTNFCTSDQVLNAYRGFARQFQNFIDDIGKLKDSEFTREIRLFCEAYGLGYRKAIVIQAANAKTPLLRDDVSKLVNTELKGAIDKSERKMKITIGETEISECGIYILEGRFNGCAPLPQKKEDWLRGTSEIEFKIVGKVPCAETFANAPLLLAERGNTEAVVGRESNTGLGWAGSEKDSGKEEGLQGAAGGIMGTLAKMQLFNIGPYKRVANKQDVRNLDSIYQILYAADRSEPLSVAEPYEDGPYCKTKMIPYMLGIGGTSLALIGGGFITNLGYGLSGVGAPFAVKGTIATAKAFYGISTTAAMCATVGLQTQAPWRSGETAGTCEFANNCLAGGIMGAGESLLTAVPNPTGIGIGAVGKSLFSKTIFDTFAFVTVGVIFDAGIYSYNTLFDDDRTYYAPAPVMYAPTKIVKMFGTRAYLTDYLVKRGMWYGNARSVASKVFTTRTLGGTGLAARDLGIVAGAAGAPTKLSELDDFLKTKSDEDILKAYRNIDSIKFAELDGLNRQGEALAVEHYSIADEFTVLDEKRAKGQILKQAYDAQKAGLDRRLIANTELLTELEMSIKNKEGALAEQARTLLREDFGKVGSIAELERRVGNSVTVADLTDPKIGLSEKEARAMVEKVNERESGLLKRAKRIGGWEFDSIEKWRKTRNFLQLLIPLLFHIDVRPVQATLDYKYSNHIVVVSDTADTTSAVKICSLKFEDDLQCANEIDAEKLCDSADFLSCLYLIKGRQYSMDQGYALFAGVNPGSDITSLMGSLVLSASKPLTKKELPDPSRIKVQYSDTITSLPVTSPPKDTISPEAPDVAAERVYQQLKESCENNDYCPGGITAAYLNEVAKYKDTNPKKALEDMLAKAKVAG